MDIKKFFNTRKKLHLSDDSKKQAEDDSKKMKDSSANSCTADRGDVFSERLDDSTYIYILHITV